ncbi:unnamed protein product [Citrullus colocynthis]|uniref:Uncharacterized protein n=1 Tax=Citrullus colocynthis TaxID=252529 RepID=A0ABP0YC73_9ROSI
MMFQYLITVFPATTSDTFSHTCRLTRWPPLHRTHVTSRALATPPFQPNQILLPPPPCSSIPIPSPLESSFFSFGFCEFIACLCSLILLFRSIVPGLFHTLLFPDFDAFCCGFPDFLSLTTFFG